MVPLGIGTALLFLRDCLFERVDSSPSFGVELLCYFFCISISESVLLTSLVLFLSFFFSCESLCRRAFTMKKTAHMIISIANMITRRMKMMLDFRSETAYSRYPSSSRST